ncbi:hypothetical protein B0H14DRAFT_2565604 [Mycena olivaceomarginata]|nr:hypothetical protein B0H14DRAFT_2565604 [Mycena olivaceomarginata]
MTFTSKIREIYGACGAENGNIHNVASKSCYDSAPERCDLYQDTSGRLRLRYEETQSTGITVAKRKETIQPYIREFRTSFGPPGEQCHDSQRDARVYRHVLERDCVMISLKSGMDGKDKTNESDECRQRLNYPRRGRWISMPMSMQERLTIRQETVENEREKCEEIPFGDFKPRLVADQSEIETRQPLRVTRQKADVRTGILSSRRFAPVLVFRLPQGD